MPTLPLLMLEIEVEALAARVLLNGVVVFDSRGGRSLRQNRRLNGWALRDGNQIEIQLARPAPGDAAFSAALRVVQPGEAVDDVPPLASYEWSAERDPLTPAPRSVFRAAVPFSAVAAWRWTTVPPVTIAGVDRAQIDELLRRLRSALVDRRPGEAVELQSIQLEEMAIAVGDDPARYRGQYADFLASYLSDPAFQVAPYDGNALTLEPMAGGRVVHATIAGLPPIRAQAGDRGMAIDPYLSRINGRWTLVR